MFDSICGSNLILINSKLHLAITEIDFNLPTYNIQIQNFFIRKSCICADECTQSFLLPNDLPDKITNNCIFNSVQIAFISVNVVLSPFHGHKVKEFPALCFYQFSGNSQTFIFVPYGYRIRFVFKAPTV